MSAAVTTITLSRRVEQALPAYASRLAAAHALLEHGDAVGAALQAGSLCVHHPGEPGGFVLHARCAVAQGEWQEAQHRWQACASRFPALPEKWRMGLAHALLQTNQCATAEAEFTAVLEADPHHLAAQAGQAQAAGGTAPDRAISLWRNVLHRAGDRAPPAWRLALARLLLARSDGAEAEAIVRGVLTDAPNLRPARALLLHVLIESDNKTQATQDLDHGYFSPNAGGTVAERLRLQTWLGHIEAARVSFLTALEGAEDGAELTSLFGVVPQNFEVFARGNIWRTMRDRMDHTAQGSGPLALCLRLRLDLALRDYDGFLDRLDAAPALPEPWATRFRRLAEILRAPAFPDFKAPRVFGIGLTKTGTTSLGRALESLGYLQAHFINPFTCEIIGDEDFPLFDAVTDSPASLRFETLYHSYPNAKFVLTERPMADWEASFERHFARSDGSYAAFRAKARQRNQIRHGAELARLHAGLYLAHDDLATAWQAYAERVDSFFATKPANKLLRHNVFTGEGWPELCAFLGHAPPAATYPWINKSAAK